TIALTDSLLNNIDLEKNILEKEEKKTTNQVKSISELWKQYKDAKASVTKYISKNNLDSIIFYLNAAADAAYELSREDIATWQLNNIGYYSINEFKSRTNYDSRMQQLATIKNLNEKSLFVEETKNVFIENYEILTRAQNYLYKAQLLDSDLEPSERTKTIESNLEFIEWIRNYISNGSIVTRSRKVE
ncbi:MAG: hypothetical protein PF549_00185, partial [Patescibacteria group bacterium]|nr:hypothetical protein [Patescibacteria group bacterium]